MKNVLAVAALAGLMMTASCTDRADEQARTAAAQQQRTIDSLNLALTRQHLIDSMNTVAAAQRSQDSMLAAANTVAPAVVAAAPAPVTRSRATRSSGRSTRGSYSGYSRNEDNNTYTPAPAQQPVAQTPVEPQRRGWSGKAKGAVIGAASGAVIGGIAHKNVKGAAVGGAIGALSGLGIGAVIDNKRGR